MIARKIKRSGVFDVSRPPDFREHDNKTIAVGTAVAGGLGRARFFRSLVNWLKQAVIHTAFAELSAELESARTPRLIDQWRGADPKGRKKFIELAEQSTPLGPLRDQ